MPYRTLLPLAAVGLLAAVLSTAGSAAQRPLPAANGDALWISDSPLEDGRRLLIVVDPATRHAAVYHVDPQGGSLTLKSARDISSDLLLDEFNVQEPTPAALRKMLQPGRETVR
jgi:hypothetical protein